MKGKLYLVATPIGNLGDISQRAIETFEYVDVVYAEDTRETGTLLKALGIKKQIKCLNDHNEDKLFDKVAADLIANKNVALVSDRGTPLISDPGYKIVSRLRREDFEVVPIPGPVALINALIASGLPTDKFLFLGFIKYKKGMLSQYCDLPLTLIFYESPKRIEKLVNFLIDELGDREISLARELTKKFETFYTGRTTNILNQSIEYKGEFVIIVGPPSKSKETVDISDEIKSLLSLDRKKLVEEILKLKYKVSKNEFYSCLYRKE